MKMNPEIKTRWVQALRSGEYEQGQSALRNLGDTFCCLGVLCDLAAQEGVVEWDGTFVRDPLSGTRRGGLLHYRVADWAGLDGRPDPYIDTPSLARVSLSELNDNGASFERIADIIEEQL